MFANELILLSVVQFQVITCYKLPFSPVSRTKSNFKLVCPCNTGFKQGASFNITIASTGRPFPAKPCLLLYAFYYEYMFASVCMYIHTPILQPFSYLHWATNSSNCSCLGVWNLELYFRAKFIWRKALQQIQTMTAAIWLKICRVGRRSLSHALSPTNFRGGRWPGAAVGMLSSARALSWAGGLRCLSQIMWLLTGRCTHIPSVPGTQCRGAVPEGHPQLCVETAPGCHRDTGSTALTDLLVGKRGWWWGGPGGKHLQAINHILQNLWSQIQACYKCLFI